MPIVHMIEEGDSVSSLSLQHGLAAKTIWADGANAELRKARSRADILLPGDQITIPDKRLKTETHAMDARHRFRRVGVPILFELQLLDIMGRPLAGLAYTLEVDGKKFEGSTDSTGYLKHQIPNDSQQGRLTVEGKVDRQIFFGYLDPIETTIGVQKRLTNLVFDCARDQGTIARATVVAFMRFQEFAGLPVTGKLDSATREEVRACYEDRRHYEELARRPAPSPFA